MPDSTAPHRDAGIHSRRLFTQSAVISQGNPPPQPSISAPSVPIAPLDTRKKKTGHWVYVCQINTLGVWLLPEVNGNAESVGRRGIKRRRSPITSDQKVTARVIKRHRNVQRVNAAADRKPGKTEPGKKMAAPVAISVATGRPATL